MRFVKYYYSNKIQKKGFDLHFSRFQLWGFRSEHPNDRPIQSLYNIFHVTIKPARLWQLKFTIKKEIGSRNFETTIRVNWIPYNPT